MRFKIISSESLGVRSMATFIEAKGIKIFIDPGVALAPRRYGLPPHPLEKEELEKVWRDIVYYAGKSDVVVVTHYHYDHYNPKRDLDIIYLDKAIFLKDFRNNINPSQIRRSHYFLHRLEENGITIKDINIADNSQMEDGRISIEFSPPFPHGKDDKLGYVVMVYVTDYEDSFLYTSDVEGPYNLDVIEYILLKDPEIIFLDGPPTYLIDRFGREYIEDSIANINRLVIFSNRLNTIILDHHFMRDKEYSVWREEIISQLPNRNIKIMSVAEYNGVSMRLLEAYRDKLYEEYPVEGS